jgi:hypothetical protein
MNFKSCQKVEDAFKSLYKTTRDLSILVANPDLYHSWTYKAVKLASSTSKTEPALALSKELEEVSKHSEDLARDSISFEIHGRRRANFGIDELNGNQHSNVSSVPASSRTS